MPPLTQCHTRSDSLARSLIEATASEPLTLEQEYEMQQSWFVDPDSTSHTWLQEPLCGALLMRCHAMGQSARSSFSTRHSPTRQVPASSAAPWSETSISSFSSRARLRSRS